MTEKAADGTAKYRLSTDSGLTFSDNNGLDSPLRQQVRSTLEMA